MTDPRVIRDAPIPQCTHQQHNLPDLEIGDSLFFAGASSQWHKDKPNHAEFWAARVFYRRRGYKMSIRTVDNGVQIWRVG